jgi:hypothetical protein
LAVPDHLVLAARDLDIGAAWLEDRLGVRLTGGGKHARMGTHNRLLGLGEGLYLELIAIDPEAPSPGRPRWFDLDRQQQLPADRPRLVHWVSRSLDIAREAAVGGEDLGEILAMERDDYRWRITVPPDGHLPGSGLVPTLIQWDVPFHPAQTTCRSGLPADEAGELSIPNPSASVRSLAALGLASALDVHPCGDERKRSRWSSYESELRAAWSNSPDGMVLMSINMSFDSRRS